MNNSIYHRPIKLNDNVYCYLWQGMGNNCNTCVFTNVLKGDKPHIIIDPGHVANEANVDCFASLENAMASDNILVKDIGLIINTHSHPDHCEADEYIINKSGANVTLSQEEDRYRTTIGEEMFAAYGIQAPQFKPLFYLKEGMFDIGNDDFPIQVFLTPGHSPGSVSLYLPDSKILVTGDVVFFMSVGRTDFPGGDLRTLEHSIEVLSKLDVECIVPGHNTDSNGLIDGKDKVKRNFEMVKMYFQ